MFLLRFFVVWGGGERVAGKDLSETSVGTLGIVTKLWRTVLADVVTSKLTKSLDVSKCVPRAAVGLFAMRSARCGCVTKCGE
jgi:hypothetical protein